jgi:hypothetical protein
MIGMKSRKLAGGKRKALEINGPAGDPNTSKEVALDGGSVSCTRVEAGCTQAKEGRLGVISV